MKERGGREERGMDREKGEKVEKEKREVGEMGRQGRRRGGREKGRGEQI